MVTTIPFLIAKVADDNDFLRLKEMAHYHDDWNLDYDKNNVKIWSKTVPDASIKMVKVWSNFTSIRSTDLFNMLLDSIYRRVWDTHMILGFDIGHLNPNNVVSYYAVSCPPPLRSRDFVLQCSWLDRGSEHFILNHSVSHKDHPPKQGFIRAISYFTGYFIKCVPLNGCEMSFVSQTDPQGFIPSWLVNKCTQILAPRFVKQLEKAAFAYSDWKTQNSPNFVPWIHPEQMTSPKISVEDCVPSAEEQQSTFFKYLLEKSTRARQVDERPIRVQFSSATEMAACSGKQPPVKSIPNKKSPVQVKGESEKEGKRKKSKGTSWLNFSRLKTRKLSKLSKEGPRIQVPKLKSLFCKRLKAGEREERRGEETTPKQFN